MREWDPGTAPSDELGGLLTTFNQVITADLPKDPTWRIESLREYLSVTMPDERRICWLAEADGEPVGYASVLLLGDIGVLELLVRPAARHGGVGRTLLTEAALRTGAEGFESLGVEVVDGTPAVGFYEAHGFRLAFVEMRNVLEMSTVDWFRLGAQAQGVGSGYRVEYHLGGPPPELFESYAAAKATLRDAPGTDLDLRPSSYDADRLRASLDTLNARGMKPHIVLAVHEPTEEVAGLTEVVVPAQRPTRADQYDTVVVPRHRGYGLGRALKARMLFELRAAEPQLVDVQTWNAAHSTVMGRVNSELGFRPDRQWREYEADVAELTSRLKALP